MLARWALAHFADRYEATILAVKSAAVEGKIKLARGQTTRTQAKSFILSSLFSSKEEAEKKRLGFGSLKKRANLWYFLVQHYGNSGILAMIPEGQTEVGVLIQCLPIQH